HRNCFDLHAAVIVPANDRARLERTCRYGAATTGGARSDSHDEHRAGASRTPASLVGWHDACPVRSDRVPAHDAHHRWRERHRQTHALRSGTLVVGAHYLPRARTIHARLIEAWEEKHERAHIGDVVVDARAVLERPLVDVGEGDPVSLLGLEEHAPEIRGIEVGLLKIDFLAEFTFCLKGRFYVAELQADRRGVAGGDLLDVSVDVKPIARGAASSDFVVDIDHRFDHLARSRHDRKTNRVQGSEML